MSTVQIRTPFLDPFLVPGMGAQGGSAEMALAGSGGDGLGSLVVCSRSLLYPKVEGDLFETETENCIRQAILETKQSLDDVLKPKIKARLRQQELIAKNKDVALLLKNAQERFEGATEKEHWEKLKISSICRYFMNTHTTKSLAATVMAFQYIYYSIWINYYVCW